MSILSRARRFRAVATRALLPAILLCATGAHALWEKVYTGNIPLDRLPILEHGGKVYIATKSGLISSPDAKTWDHTKFVLTGTVSQMISEGNTLWAATHGGNGVQYTTDNAQTWKAASDGLGNKDVGGLVRLGGALFAATKGGVFRSRDDGKTWQAVNTGLAELTLNCLESVGTTLFAGTGSKGVYRSKDMGDHWEAANKGYPGKGSYLFATDGKTLFSVPIDHMAVNHSPDLGDSWNNDTTGMGVKQFPHALDDYGPNVYWVHDRNVNGGVHITIDGGKTWSNINKDADPHRIERPKAAGFGLGYMIVGSESYGIWIRPASEVDILPVAVRRETLGAPVSARPWAEGRALCLRSEGGLKLSVYDPAGALLGERKLESAGLHRLELAGSAGRVFYRLQGSGAAQTGFVVLP